jgi:NADH:ubiquinone oxidoreductase subunit 5 (subunit L)/multisubunit Na+/H+ antiporter MnhA subunit
MIVNRIGDIGLICSMGCLINLVGSLDFNIIKSIGIFDFSGCLVSIELIGYGFIVAAIGKSAQIGLHT